MQRIESARQLIQLENCYNKTTVELQKFLLNIQNILTLCSVFEGPNQYKIEIIKPNKHEEEERKNM